MLLICIPASATQNIIFTDWNADHAYVGTFNITGSTPSDNWKFVIPSTEAGIIYKLYSISDASVKDTNTSTSSVVLEASNLSDGQYYILQMIPNIEVTKHNPNNVSCNSEFTLSNSTPATNISYILKNVTSGNVYKIYDPSTLAIYGSGVAGSSNATINVTGLPDGQYRIAETGSERIIITEWNLLAPFYIGNISIYNSTPISTWNITIDNSSAYKLVTNPNNVTVGVSHTIDGRASIVIRGLIDGTYWIVRGQSWVTSYVVPTLVVASLIVPTVVIASLFYKRRKHSND